MEPTLQYQLRLTVSPELADALRADPASASHRALRDLLLRHDATLKCQFDAFADYVREAQQQGTENYPLYQWTLETIQNPEKQARYLRSFTVYVNGGEVYGKDVTDIMENELLGLVSEDGVQRVSRFDTNPANNPQPPTR